MMRSLTIVLVCVLVAGTATAEPLLRVLTLGEAIELALRNNPDIATARHRAAAARAGIDQTEASLWPRLTVGGGYAASDNPVQVFMMDLNQRNLSFGPSTDFNDPSATDNINGHVTASYTLYNGGRDKAQRDAARLIAEASEHSIDAVRNDLVFEVTRAFHTIQKARGFVRAAEQSVASMEANVKTAQARVETGNSLKTDVLDAEVRLAEARENVVRTRNAVKLAEAVFRNVIGEAQVQPVTVADERTSPTGDETTTDPAETSNVCHRPEFLVMLKAIAAAEQQVRGARSGYRPRVNAFASYDLNSGNGTDYADSWLAGVSVEVDLFDGFLPRGKVAEAQARWEEAREQLRKLELGLQLEARQAQLNVEEAKARLDTTARAVQQAEESLQITKDRYANGMALLTQVLDAETALTAARQRRAAAESDVHIAQASWVKAIGRSVTE
jgi:outer membrane protein TolC